MPDTKHRLYRRTNGTYYQQDNQTGTQVSLRTKDKRAAQEKLRAANEAVPSRSSILISPAFICAPTTRRSVNEHGQRQ